MQKNAHKISEKFDVKYFNSTIGWQLLADQKSLRSNCFSDDRAKVTGDTGFIGDWVA